MKNSQNKNERSIAERTEVWMDAIAPYNFRERQISPGQAALLIIDMQKFFLSPGNTAYTPSGLEVLPNVKMLLEECRRAAIPVLYTRHEHFDIQIDTGAMGGWWPEHCMQSAEEADVHEELKPLPSEKVITKRRYSGFFQTDLELSLRGLGCTDLIISGIMTNMCCESTARDAFFRDFNVYFVADGTGATDDDLHLSSLRNIAYGFGKVVTTSDMLSAISERMSVSVE